MSNETAIEKNYGELESRLKKLESANKWAAFLQYLVYPLILALIGLYFKGQIESAKDATQRMQIVQSMLTSMFAGNHAQALVSERILVKVTDAPFAAEITQIVEDYYVNQMQTAVKGGDLDFAVKILTATDAVGGSLKDKITAGVGARTLQTVQGAQLAAEKERVGYDDLISGKFAKALDDFDASEKAHSGFHHSYEIAQLLRQHRQELDKPAVQRQVLNRIVTQYWGYIPNDVLQKLRQASTGLAGVA
jgi:hypothetical protein